MSLRVTPRVEGDAGFPRVSGDEPVVRWTGPTGYKFSPGERG